MNLFLNELGIKNTSSTQMSLDYTIPEVAEDWIKWFGDIHHSCIQNHIDDGIICSYSPSIYNVTKLLHGASVNIPKVSTIWACAVEQQRKKLWLIYWDWMEMGSCSGKEKGTVSE